MKVQITHIDTACILLEINGYRILTDPTLDKAGGWYHHGYGSASHKTSNPAVSPADLKDIDLILLSHHQHKDNLDNNGKAFMQGVSKVISTVAAAKALNGVIGLKNWQTHNIDTDKISNLHITATPAQHHPWWLPEFFAGPVIGFIIEFDGQDNGVIYISGDTVYFKGIEEVGRRYNIDIGIFHLGSVQFRYLTGFGRYTMNSKDLLKAVNVLNPRTIIPIHYTGWTHFKEKEQVLRTIIASSPSTKDKTIFLKPGERTEVF